MIRMTGPESVAGFLARSGSSWPSLPTLTGSDWTGLIAAYSGGYRSRFAYLVADYVLTQ